MSPPDVSVVVPTFRRAEALLVAVRSALSSGWPSVEVIVVDDSPEGSARVPIERLDDPRVRWVLHDPPSRGRPALVRAAGARLARGRYVHFLDDDDELEEGALAALADRLDHVPDAGVAFGRITPTGEQGPALARERAYFDRAAARARAQRTRLGLAASLLFHDALLVCSACMVRREVAAAVEWDDSLPYCEDGDFFLRAIRRFGFTFVDRPVVRYRTGGPSLMNDAKRRMDVLGRSYRAMQTKYRREHGALELWTLRALAALPVRAP